MSEVLTRSLRVAGEAFDTRVAPAQLPGFLTAADGVEIVAELAATPRPALRSIDAATLDLEVELEPDTAYVVVARQPSGALTFHLPIETRRAAAASSARFRIPCVARRAQRGFATGVLRAVVLKVLGLAVDRALPGLAAAWEKKLWASKGRATGLVRVDRDALTSGAFRAPVREELGREPTLVLVHGTFSHTAGAFGPLGGEVGRDLFELARDRYGGRVVAWQHHTVSATPAENAAGMLDALHAAGAGRCDFVTHSRGGLVLLEACARPRSPGVDVGRAVLVACPTEGTPLASARRWDLLLSFVANVLDVLPDNPFTEAVSFVSEGIRWLAARATGALPGLAAMDPDGETVAELAESPAAARLDAYALMASYTPPPALLARAADLAVDGFFGVDNDLVVPTLGGARLGGRALPSDRVGCFGTGGNLAHEGAPIDHVRFFGQSATVRFLTRALRGAPLEIPAMKPGALRAADAEAPVAAPSARIVDTTTTVTSTSGDLSIVERTSVGSFHVGAPVVYPSLQITFLPVRGAGADHYRYATVLATYGSARAFAEVDLRADRMKTILETHEKIRAFLDGAPDASEPDEETLRRYGCELFDLLFIDGVRRLYDAARARQGDDLLEIVVTSAHGDLYDLPWEFAYDPSRGSWLATEDVVFVRNVVTATPADDLPPERRPLSILAVAAQPLGTAALSVEQEIAVLRAGFEHLERAGLAKVVPLPRATPAALHSKVQTGEYDVVHFIGHGEYDARSETGYLLFEDDTGARQRVGVRTLREILAHRRIRLLFLNACETGRGDRVDFNRGVAPALVAAGLPVVVANQYKVFDPSAVAFAQHFYWLLAQGESVGIAARESRIAVNYMLHGEAIDWAVPVLYTRDARQTRLVARAAGRGPIGSLEFGRSTRARRGATERSRIGVWDVRGALPQLERILARLDEVQDVYRFERIPRLSVPLGTWRRVRVDGEIETYIHAEYIARRLKDVPQALGLDYLVCVTDQPLMGDEIVNLFQWWGLEPEERVGVLSTWAVDRLDEPERVARGTANAIVSVLASRLLGKDTHERGPSSCPLYFNEERDDDVVTSRLRFDGPCRRGLRAKSEQHLRALDQLLGAFD